MNLKIGDKIEILEMVGEPQYTGKVGVVDFIDDAGQVHGTWGGLAVQPSWIPQAKRTMQGHGVNHGFAPVRTTAESMWRMCRHSGRERATGAMWN